MQANNQKSIDSLFVQNYCDDAFKNKKATKYKLIVTFTSPDGSVRPEKETIKNFGNINECKAKFEEIHGQKGNNLKISNIKIEKKFTAKVITAISTPFSLIGRILRAIAKLFKNNTIEKHLGKLSPNHEEVLKNKNAKNIISEFIKESDRYRSENLEKLKSDGFYEAPEGQIHLSRHINDQCANLDLPKPAQSIIQDVSDLTNPAANNQYHTDPFYLGLPAGSQPNDGNPPTIKRRYQDTEKSSSGYATTLQQRRALWIDIKTRTDVNGEEIFISGTRQLSFKLPNGAKMIAEAKLDLSTIAPPLTKEQTQVALKFILESAKTPLKELNNNNLKEEVLNVLEKPVFQDLDLTKQTIRLISQAFNKELEFNRQKAILSLTPDIKASCLDSLAHIYGEQWAAAQPILETLWKNSSSSLELTHSILALHDEILYLEILQKHPEFETEPQDDEEAPIEFKKQITDDQVAAKKQLLKQKIEDLVHKTPKSKRDDLQGLLNELNKSRV